VLYIVLLNLKCQIWYSETSIPKMKKIESIYGTRMQVQHCCTDTACPRVNTKEITSVIYVLLYIKLSHSKTSTLQQSVSLVSQLEAMRMEQSSGKKE